MIEARTFDAIAARIAAAPVMHDAPSFKATPFVWRDPATIPPRPWIYGRQLLRGAVSLIVAPGGTGKSALTAGMAVSLATGRELLRERIWGGAKRAWLWNLEDSSDELARSVQAAMLHWQIDGGDVAERLYIDSGLDGPGFKLAKLEQGGVQIIRPVSDGITAELRARDIDVLIIDPFVSSHSVPENDNPAIDMVAKEWASIAAGANCAILLVHHTSKRNGQASDADSARGATSLVNAARFVLALNPMDKEAGEAFGIDADQRRRFVRCDAAKSNRAPAGDARWIELASVSLGNADATYADGDQMAVVVPWTPPDAFAGICPADLVRVQEAVTTAAGAGNSRKSTQSGRRWVGHAIADALGLDSDRDRRRLNRMIGEWLRNGVLVDEVAIDEARKPRPVIVAGKLVEL
jgi:hypothetical protein